MRVVLRILGLVVIVGYAAWLVSLNAAPVDVDLGFKDWPAVQSWLVILGSLLLGALAAGLMVRYRLRLRKSRQRIGELEQELHGLRTLPLGDGAAEGEPKAREA